MAATVTASETRPVRHTDGAAVRSRAEPASPAFPGCTPVHLPRAELEHFERRLEYWDAATETAWVCEPVTSYHERPSRLLPQLTVSIARVRGSHIECYGSMDLLRRDPHGEPQLIMQADESLYLHPDRAKLPAAAMVVGEDDFPDVVLEVDHTTDARRGKLSLYESWGFPEVWVDVPDAPSPNRPRGLRPGMTIHLLEDGRYRVADESQAFPRLDGGRDSRGAERACAFGADERRAGACGWSAGRAGRYRTGRRPVAALATASGVRARPRADGPPDTVVAGHRGF